ncbi:MAG: BCCT family transporter, partial [Myxococcota bacterium]
MTEEQRTSTKNNAVTAGLAGGVFVCFCGSALVNLDWTTTQLDAAFAWTTAVFGLGWQVLTVLTLIGALAIAGSPWGAIRLGGRSEPELPYGRWLAIILCTLLAGGGVFWSAAEPMFHFTSPPPTFPGVEAGAAEAVAPALAQAYFHWGFLAWAVVGTLGAITLLVHEERGVPLTPRALLAGFVNEKLLAGPLGSVVDAVAIIAALAGTIGPIGFLGLQLAYAAKALLGAPDGYGTQLVVLGALVTLATVSAVSGIDRGIQFLSRLNVGLALGLATAIVLLGPTAFIFRSFFEALGTYAVALPRLAFFRADPAWLDYWTVFYWGWFLSYAPLMSIFVARISRGRSIREIVLAVAVVAPLLTNFWFSILGGSGIAFELTNAGSVSDAL